MTNNEKESYEADLEYEFRMRTSNGEKIDIEEFLNIHKLTAIERRRLKHRLERWEQALDGFEEYYRTINIDSLLEKIWKHIEEEKCVNQPGIIASIKKKLDKVGKQVVYEIIPRDSQLVPISVGTAGATRSISKDPLIDDIGTEGTQIYLWSGEIVNGLRIQITPKNRVLFEFPAKIGNNVEIDFTDSEGNKVYPKVTHPLDKYGIAGYDLSVLPDGKYSLIIHKPTKE